MKPVNALVLALVLWSAPPAWTAKHPARSRVIAMQATAFAGRRRPTAAGTVPHEGIVAADPAVLPLGTRIRVTGTGPYDGIYVVTDTGNRIEGQHLDMYVDDPAGAKRFGTKQVRVQVLQEGRGKRDARRKDVHAAGTR